MKTSLKFLILIAVTALFIWACSSKDDSPLMMDDDVSVSDDVDPTDDDPTGTTDGFMEVDVQVILPQGSTVDLGVTSLVSISEEFSVSGNGNSKVALNKNGRSLALLIDTDQNILLMGFIDEDQREISVRSTAIASLYNALGTVFLPEDVRQRFFDEIDDFPGLNELVEAATTAFSSDENYFGTEAFAAMIGERISTLDDAKTNVDTTSRINADGSDIRSGIQLREDDSFSFSLINSFRRRAHAFVYRKEVTFENGGVEQLISDFNAENPTPNNDEKISSPTAIREVFGVISDYGAGTGIGFAITEAGPISLEVEEGEQEVLYSCRVVGTALGEIDTNQMTTIEEEKLYDLIYETFAFELVLPILLDVAGHSKLLKGLDETKYELFVNQLQIIASSVPAVDEPLKKGEYQTALNEFLKAYYNNALGANATDLIEALFEGVVAGGVKVDPDYFVQNSARAGELVQGIGKYLERADIFLKLVDYSRILYANSVSNHLEEWDVVASKNDVTIIPEETIAIQGEEKTFKAIIKDGNLSAGQSYEYRWATSGLYGVIRDELGKEGTSFTSSRSEIQYFSSNVVDLPDEAFDEITVEVFLKEGQNSTRINDAKAVVEVKELGFEITPENPTVNGGTRITLKVRNTDRTDITDNSTQDYRIVWDGASGFGLFNGNQNTVSKVNDPRVIYEAVEKEKEGTETITAAIYARRKDSGDAYRFIDKLETTINIENDENVKYLYPRVGHLLYDDPNGPEGAYGYFVFFEFDPEVNAESYSLRVKELKFGNNTTSFVNQGDNWTAGNPDDLVNGKYRFITYTGSGPGSARADAAAALATLQGYAQVRVVLKSE
ncbi:hypothetical protein [Allomuricauda sp. R78024]|uniref:hypothetical protein n=1 Tax=Allomuricauda sp. R78024 TaxID=3093867 RepID=UPI0037CC02D6